MSSRAKRAEARASTPAGTFRKVEWNAAELDRRFNEMVGDPNDDSPSARKRRRILRAAYELFLAHGYRRTSIDDVARKADVAKGTVYLYFPNKGQLLVSAVALEKATMRAQAMKLFDGSIPKGERLHYWLTIALTAARDLPLVSRLLGGDSELISALEDVGHEELQSRMSEGVDFVVSMIDEDAPDLDETTKRVRAEAIVSLGFVSAKFLEVTRAGCPIDELARALADMIVAGVGAVTKKKDP